MQKTYQRINWENYPSENTPLNESNLNRMDAAIDELDDRVITLDTEKADQTIVNDLIASIAVDDQTGVITVTKENGSTVQIQTTLNKIAVNFGYDYNSQELLLTLNDGTVARINLSSLIQNNEFANTDTIALSVSSLGIVTANIIRGSITDDMLRTDYLADIRVSEANAAASESAAEEFMLEAETWARGTRASQPVSQGDPGYEDNSKYWKDRAEAWAVGEIDGGSVPNTDITYENNSKFYASVSEQFKDAAEQIRQEAADLLETVTNRLTGLNLMVNYADGCLYYDINSGIRLVIDYTTGDLMYEVVT